MANNSGSAQWQGGLKDGKGTISTQSGVLSDQPYGFNTRFEDGAGTNPEELIGAAHAACFSMAFGKQLEDAGITGVTIDTTSTISLEKQADGFAITKARLTCRVTGDGDKAKIEELAHKAETGCPVSKVLNAEVSLDLTVG